MSLSRYAANSEAFRLAPECAACSKAHADGLLVDEDAPPPSPGGRLALAPSPVAARLAPVPSPPARLAPAPSPPPGVPPKFSPQAVFLFPEAGPNCGPLQSHSTKLAVILSKSIR